MWLWVGDLVDALVGWLLDGAARGEQMPAGATAAGLCLAVAGAGTLLVLGVRAWRRRGDVEAEPAQVGKPWWATKAVDADPKPVRASAGHGYRRPARSHVVPAHPARPEPVTELIPRVADDPDATIAIPTEVRRG
jgi:hypothetical protein